MSDLCPVRSTVDIVSNNGEALLRACLSWTRVCCHFTFWCLLGWMYPACPDCSCSCREAAVVHQIPPALASALDFCHSSVAECKNQESSPTFYFSLFWFELACGVLATAVIFILLLHRQSSTTKAPPAPVGAAPQPANLPLVAAAESFESLA